MPDGTPAPTVMTELELVRFLRLDEEGRDPSKARNSIQHYREKRLLRGCRIGRNVRYTLAEVLRFLEAKVAEDNDRRARA